MGGKRVEASPLARERKVDAGEKREVGQKGRCAYKPGLVKPKKLNRGVG